MRHLATVAVALGVLVLSAPRAPAFAAQGGHAAALINTNGPAQQYRLTMKLTVIETSDAHHGRGNTQDEIYFAVAGFTMIGGVDTLRRRRTVRPQISRDFWEMGSHSAHEVQVTVFEGPLGADDLAVFGVLIGEQDSHHPQESGAIVVPVVTDIARGLAAELTAAGVSSSPAIDALGREFAGIGREITNSGDELMGAVELLVQGDTLIVRAPTQALSLLSSTATTAAVELGRGGGKYRVEFALEDNAPPRATTQTFLSREHSRCTRASLSVEIRGGGTKTVRPGAWAVRMDIDGGRLRARCGNTSASVEIDVPRETRRVDVTRDAAGTVTWDCFHTSEATPQYHW